MDVTPGYAVEPETEDFTGDAADWVAKGADWVVFASALAIEHVHQRFDLPGLLKRFPGTRLAIANQSIKWALEKLGLEPSVISEPEEPELLANQIAESRGQKSI